MKIGPLSIFQPQRDNHGKRCGTVVAALHWKWSITWRWVLSYNRTNPLVKYGFHCHRTYTYKPGWNGRIILNLPVIGYLTFNMQPNMRESRKYADER